MAAPVCLNDVNTIAMCWCECQLTPLIGQSGTGWASADVEELHEHLRRFNFDLELSNSRSGTPAQSQDEKDKKWGPFTTRAVRMFAKHPKVKTATERVLSSDGKKITAPIAEKIREWCRDGIVSPKNYWEFPQLKLHRTDQLIDAYGNDLGKGTQSAYHHHVRQIQEDLAKIGFAVHDDALCGIGKPAQPDGVYREVSNSARNTNAKELRDLKYLTRKFQRQAQWLWRMNKDGRHLPDVLPGDITHYTGAVDGVMDYQTAMVLHAWAERDLHMVIAKFELKELHWPPESAAVVVNSDGGGSAKLRSDAYEKWLSAAKTIHSKNATIEGEYASSPRNWTGGKPSASSTSESSASAFSWHYSALGVDLSQSPASGDGTVSNRFRYVREEEGNKFRIWCRVVPQPPAPANYADDKQDAYTQYRNRNIKNKVSINGGDLYRDASKASEADPSPLGHMCNTHVIKTVLEGWYVDITKILEENDLERIPRKANWQTKKKSWEWWHYQYRPGRPPGASADATFGEYLQLFGVHEYHLRQKRWSSHADFEHAAG